MWPGFFLGGGFLKKLLLCNVRYIELFTRKILMLNAFFFFFFPDGITPNSGLTGSNDTYIYMGQMKST